MSCKAYKNTLRDAAATSAVLGDGVQAHLRICADCRIAFDEFQKILAAVDAGVRHVANTPPSPALFPRIQRGVLEIEHDTLRIQHRIGWRFALIPAAALLLLSLLPFAARQYQSPTTKPPIGPHVLPSISESRAAQPAEKMLVELNPRRSKQIHRERIAQTVVSFREPEILVSSEEQDSLRMLMDVVHNNKETAKELAAPVTRKELNALQVAPLQIARLQLEPLDTTGGQLVGSGESR